MNPMNQARVVLIGGAVLLVLGLVLFAVPAQHAQLPPRVFYETAGGPVLFPHDRHAGFECASCHHELLNEKIEMTCTLCHHAESFGAGEWEDEDMAEMHMELASDAEDHTTCMECHPHSEIRQPVAAASQASCSACHDEDLEFTQMGHNCSACHGASDSEDVLACSSCHTTDEGEASSCEACHEADGYTADMLEHGDLVSIEGHTCTGCHAVSRGADAVHKRCNRCHADLEKGTFFTRSKDEPESVCKTCHMKR